jgi:DEAD/DEAH box helicase domain-containing protein
VASVTLGNSKTAEGLGALKWWAEYEKTGDPQKMLDIARYCCFDVKVTMEVYKFGAENGYVNYVDKKGNIIRIDVDWKLDW